MSFPAGRSGATTAALKQACENGPGNRTIARRRRGYFERGKGTRKVVPVL